MDVGEDSLVVLQQMESHNSGVLSVEELSYRNPNKSDEEVVSIIASLQQRGLVTKHVVDTGPEPVPDTYWSVSDKGIEQLKVWGFHEEILVLSALDNILQRTDRIETIEQFNGRPTVSR